VLPLGRDQLWLVGEAALGKKTVEASRGGAWWAFCNWAKFRGGGGPPREEKRGSEGAHGRGGRKKRSKTGPQNVKKELPA